MTAPTKPTDRKQKVTCPTCRESLRSLLDACPKPDCIARQTADEARWERWSD